MCSINRLTDNNLHYFGIMCFKARVMPDPDFAPVFPELEQKSLLPVLYITMDLELLEGSDSWFGRRAL